jgi:hypothetical protein
LSLRGRAGIVAIAAAALVIIGAMIGVPLD